MQLLKIEITAHGCVGMAHNYWFGIKMDQVQMVLFEMS
jgi:hypothetical protein